MINLLKPLEIEDLSLGKEIKANKGDILFHEGETCQYVGILKEGLLSISSFSYEGKEIIFSKINVGEPFGHNLLFSSSKKYKGDVVVSASKASVLLFSKENFMKILSRNPSFLESYLHIESDDMKTLNQQVKLLSFPSLEERFLYLLYINKGEIDIVSVSSLAKELRSERETLSRLVSKLEKEGKIIRIGNKIKGKA